MAGSGLNEMRYVIPTEWDYVSIGDYISSSSEKNKQENDFEVYTISNIYGFIKSDEFFDKRVYSRDLSNYKIVRKGYFAYNPYRINVGSLGLYEEDEPGLVSPAYTVFFVDENASLSPEFLFLLLKSNLYRNEIVRYAMSVGSIRRVLAFKDLVAFKIPLPPLPEQRAIAHVLSTVRQAIEATEGVIAAARELKRSMMKHLFTYGPVPVDQADQVPLKETECWEVPEHWDVTEFGNVATLQRGKDLPKRKRIPGDYPIIGSNGIVGYHNKFVTEGKGVFVGRSGSVGKVKRINSAYWPLNTALWVKDFHGNDRDFIYYLLSNFDFRKYASGVSVPTLNRNLVHPVKIGVPTIGIQIRIAKILNSIDQKINTEEIKKKSIENLFNGLLHNLMTGKVRVKT